MALVQIPSHYSVQEAIRLGLNPGVVLANAVADEVAGHFALQVQLPYAKTAGVQLADGLARKVLNHLVSVQADVFEKAGRRPVRPPKPRARISRRELLRKAALATSHKCPMICGDFAQCTSCGCSSSSKDVTKFLSTPCVAMNWTGAIFRPSASTCVRSRLVDPSHAVGFWPEANVLWCLTCGSYSTHHLRELATPCTGRLSRAGAQNISRIARGLLPGSCVWGRERQERARERGQNGERAASAGAPVRRVAALDGDAARRAPPPRRRPASAAPRLLP